MSLLLKIYDACETGELEVIKNFFNSDESKSENHISSHLMAYHAIKGNNLDILKIIFKSSFKKEKLFDKFTIGDYSRTICSYASLDILKFMLGVPEIIKNKGFMERLPRSIASSGRLDMIQYLFDHFSDDPSVQANVVEGDILIHASMHGNLNILEFIFNDNRLKDNINIHIYNDEAFRNAINNKQTEVLKYFIFDLGIEKTKSIIKHMENDKIVISMFTARELNQELSNNIENIKKNKI